MLFVGLVVGLVLFGVVSCNEQPSQDADEPFDSSVDGVAVRAMPQIDVELAKRIIKDGKDFSLTADATTEETEVESVAPVEGEAPSGATDSPNRRPRAPLGNSDPNDY